MTPFYFSSGSGPEYQVFRWWFEWYVVESDSFATSTLVSIPLWLLILLTGIPAAWMFRTDRRRRRAQREGLCGKCGYDLRGDLTAGCPECGWNRVKDAQ